MAESLLEDGMTLEVKRFFEHVRIFYVKFVATMFKKFPFNSTLLSDLRVLNPAERRAIKDLPNAVVRLAKELPQLQLTGKLNELKTEAIDYQMADASDLPDETNVDLFWAAMHNVTEVGGAAPTYSHLLTLVRALLALPASNADSERCLSMVRKIDTEERTQLQRSTVGSLLTLKLNVDEECYEYEPPMELLSIN